MLNKGSDMVHRAFMNSSQMIPLWFKEVSCKVQTRFRQGLDKVHKSIIKKFMKVSSKDNEGP